jgi:autotransporter passenger strand-loop-strand repeat protein
VLSGGTVDLAGGVFSGTIASGGSEAVAFAANRPVYRDLTVSNGVTLTVSSGGKTSGTDIRAGGVEIVGSGAAERQASVMSGGEIVLAGGTAAINALSGSTIGVASGVRIDGETIGSGVTLVVSSGALARSTTLGSGATEFVGVGGLIRGTTTMGADTTLDVVTALANSPLTVSGFSNGDMIVLASFTQAEPTFQYAPTVGAARPQGVLTVTGDSRTISIQLFGQYAAAGFRVDDVAQNVMITYSPPAAEGPADIAAAYHPTGR